MSTICRIIVVAIVDSLRDFVIVGALVSIAVMPLEPFTTCKSAKNSSRVDKSCTQPPRSQTSHLLTLDRLTQGLEDGENGSEDLGPARLKTCGNLLGRYFQKSAEGD